MEGAVQGEREDDDPRGQGDAGDDREHDADPAAAGDVQAQHGIGAVEGGQRVSQLSPVGRAHVAQI